MKSSLLSAGLLALLNSCTPQNGRSDVRQRLVLQTDFEAPDRASSDSLLRSLTTRRAHSGKTALLVDWQHQSSGAYRVPLGSLFNFRPHKLHFSAWAWVEQYEDDATVVVAISAPDNPNRRLLQKTIYLADNGPYRQWKEVALDLDMPQGISHASQLTIYARHHMATNPVYIDDWKLFEIR